MSKSWFVFGFAVLVMVRVWTKRLQPDSALTHQMLDWEGEGGRIPDVRAFHQGR